MSWWQTLPGVLSAIAAVLTAVTGLIVVLGPFDSEPESEQSPSAATAPARAVTDGPGDASRPAPEQSPAYRVIVPGRAVASLGQGKLIYTIEDVSTRQRNPGELEVRFTIRLKNTGDYDANFWGRTFRLLVDGGSQAPVPDDLNELVAGKSSGEGTISFAVAETANELALMVGDVKLPLTISKR